MFDCKSPPPPEQHIIQLQQQLVEWMSTVDQRLDTLLEAVQHPSPTGYTSERPPLKRSSCYSFAATSEDIGLAGVGSTFCSSDDLDGDMLKQSDLQRSNAANARYSSQNHEERKQNRRRLLTRAFFRKCNSIETNNTVKSAKSKHIMEKIVKHRHFDYTVAVILFVNALLIGVEVERKAQGYTDHIALLVVEWIFAFLFAVELALRLRYNTRNFCSPESRWWALWDVILVVLSGMDLVLRLVGVGGSNGFSLAHIGSTGRLLKIARMMRILRLLRMVRFLTELRVMANMIQKSMKSLFWLFSLLVLLIYIFSVVLTQGTTDHLDSLGQQGGPVEELLQERYSSVLVTMYTLFQAMCGGVSWGEVTTPLQEVGVFYFITSLLYIFFAIFSVFNIVTGVFVDGAIELAKQDRSMLTAKKHLSREASALALADLLKDMDTDGDGVLTLTELQNSLLRTEVQEYMDALCVDTSEAEMIFSLLDEDGNGQVDIEEFVSGMQRLQGEAKNFDIHVLIHNNQRVLDSFSTVFNFINSLKVSDVAAVQNSHWALQTAQGVFSPPACSPNKATLEKV